MLSAMHPPCLTCWRMERDLMNRDNDMGRNAEHYADPTPTAAMKNIRKDECQKDAATMLQISILVPLLRQVADLAGGPNPSEGQKHREGVAITWT